MQNFFAQISPFPFTNNSSIIQLTIKSDYQSLCLFNQGRNFAYSETLYEIMKNSFALSGKLIGAILFSKYMNPEIPQFEQPKNIEADVEQQELSPEQKKTLGEVWTEMVIDNESVPENIGEIEQTEIKKWLFDSIMKDIEKFSEELGLQIDAELVEKIQKAESLEEKSALELEYIKKAHAQVDEIVQRFDKSANKSTKWDSWPKRMREAKEFNCVGATLLGIYLLEKGGIESQYGNPHGHVINIAKLSNGEWWYVDFRNGKQNIIKLEPEETKIADVPTLKINQPNIDYKLIPLYDNSKAAGSVLGNLSSLKHEAEDESTPDEDIEKKEARKYLEQYGQNFQKADFSFLHQSLYSKFIEFDKTDEMQKEIARIDSMRDFEKPVQNFTKTLTKEQEKALVEEIKTKKEGIENLFYKDDKSVWLCCINII